MLKIYNTLTRKKEKFIPLEEGKVKMYACGITVSGNAHIGHLFQAMVYDLIRKVLEKNGYQVRYARNYTDIDDKIIASANRLGIDSKVYADDMIKKIDEEMKYFQVDEPTMWLKATDNVQNIIDFVSILVEKGYAYPTKKGDVYYSVEKFKNYGCLSNRSLDQQKDGYRIDNDEDKNSPLDFALWKSAKEGEPYWQSPWGKGRPGWHIECSTMNRVAFGDQIDIHGGGRDLIFPHHENEIAQTEAVTGKRFASYWIHNGLIKVNGQKMSKSLGNSIILEDLRKKYHPEVVKFALFSNSYRSDLNLTDEVFALAEKHIFNFYNILKQIETNFDIGEAVNDEFDAKVLNALNDDFNTPKALSYLFEIFKDMARKVQENDNSVVADYNGVKKAYKILGLFVNDADKVLKFIENKNLATIPTEVETLAKERWQAKQNKNFALADEVRAKISALGYVVKDTKDGYEIAKM